MNTLIESTIVKKAGIANAATAYAYPFYAAQSQAASAAALFWSVFGPAARYNFGNSGYAYAALLKP